MRSVRTWVKIKNSKYSSKNIPPVNHPDVYSGVHLSDRGSNIMIDRWVLHSSGRGFLCFMWNHVSELLSHLNIFFYCFLDLKNLQTNQLSSAAVGISRPMTTPHTIPGSSPFHHHYNRDVLKTFLKQKSNLSLSWVETRGWGQLVKHKPPPEARNSFLANPLRFIGCIWIVHLLLQICFYASCFLDSWFC